LKNKFFKWIHNVENLRRSKSACGFLQILLSFGLYNSNSFMLIQRGQKMQNFEFYNYDQLAAENYREAVMRVQICLIAISNYTDGAIPRMLPSGVYDAETAASVSVFQRDFGLPETGVVDYDTWIALNEAYDAVIAQTGLSAPIYPFEQTLAGGSVNLGEADNLVSMIQAMLETIGIFTAGASPVAVTGVYDPATEAAIADLQRIAGLPETGAVDRATWNILADTYNKYLNRQ